VRLRRGDLVETVQVAAAVAAEAPAAPTTDALQIDNGTATVGCDRSKGGAITWLSWDAYPRNAVNVADPGRLIQQSYYAGLALDRRSEGQSAAWSPWTWNPIQGGGVDSWARVLEFAQPSVSELRSVTIPKLWDMPDEEAAAEMRQTVRFEPGLPHAVVVECEFAAQRESGDRWGPAVPRHQEIPACYFTRNFSDVRSYLGDGRWRSERQPPGPPWGRVQPPRKAMACFNAAGQGIALFSPCATQPWNFGPHGGGASDDPAAGPCMHVAAIDEVSLGPRSRYQYRYWLVVGDAAELASALDRLDEQYGAQQAVFTP
jgi:hypothetical protein